MGKEDMVAFTVYVAPAFLEELKAGAKAEGRSLSSYAWRLMRAQVGESLEVLPPYEPEGNGRKRK